MPGGAVLTRGVFRRSGSVAYVRADASPTEVLADPMMTPQAAQVNQLRDGRSSVHRHEHDQLSGNLEPRPSRAARGEAHEQSTISAGELSARRGVAHPVPASGPDGQLRCWRARIHLSVGARGKQVRVRQCRCFSWQRTFENLALVDGPTALIVSDGDDHRRRRSVVAPGLSHRQIQDYVQIMVSAIDTAIDSWRPGQRVDIYQQCRRAVRRSTAESLFGQRIAGHSEFLGEQLQPLLNLTHQLPQVVALQQRLNLPAWRRAKAARARIDDLIDVEIAAARAHPAPGDHMLTMLINGRSEDGYALSDNEIRDSIVSLITAGYETTSGALSWAIYTLLTLPGAWDKATDEVNRVLGDQAPTAADVEALTYLVGVVHETASAVPAWSDLCAQGDAGPCRSMAGASGRAGY